MSSLYMLGVGALCVATTPVTKRKCVALMLLIYSFCMWPRLPRQLCSNFY